MSRIVTEDDHKLITRALAAEGGHLGIGHAGFHLEWGNGWFSGYDCDELKQACIARGLPVIDNRNVSYGALCWIVICGPLVAVGKPADPPPSRSDPPEGQAAERPEGGALSYAPLAVIAAPAVPPVWTCRTSLKPTWRPARVRSPVAGPSNPMETRHDRPRFRGL